MTYLERAIKDGYAHITGAVGKRQIAYILSNNHFEHYDDPEEAVRAEVWAELIYGVAVVFRLLTIWREKNLYHREIEYH